MLVKNRQTERGSRKTKAMAQHKLLLFIFQCMKLVVKSYTHTYICKSERYKKGVQSPKPGSKRCQRCPHK